MSQDLTPEHMRCDVVASCPSITRLDDGRLLIVGTDAHDLAIKYGIAPSPFEEAIVISPSLLDTLMEEARREEREKCAEIADHEACKAGENCKGCVEREKACLKIAAAIRIQKD